MSNWKSKASFITPTGIESQVGTEKVKFYPVSVATAFKIKKIGGDLAGAFGLIFIDNRNDSGSIQENFPLDKDNVGNRLVVEPVGVPLATLRAEQRARGFAQIFDAIMSDENKNIVAEIVMESMREVFPPGDRENPPVEEFLKTVPLPAFTELCIGAFLANKGVFGPFVTQAQSLLKSVMDDVLAKMEKRKTKAPATSTLGNS